MKAYHIAKAQGPSDLPDWLFDERERQVANVQAQPEDIPDDQNQTTKLLENDTTPAPRAQKVATSTPFNSVSSQPRLRGTDRLKAMRDAKRDGAERNEIEGFSSRSGLATDSTAVPQSANRQARVGLPSGPGRGRRY